MMCAISFKTSAESERGELGESLHSLSPSSHCVDAQKVRATRGGGAEAAPSSQAWASSLSLPSPFPMWSFHWARYLPFLSVKRFHNTVTVRITVKIKRDNT